MRLRNRAKQFSSVTSKPSKSVTTCYSIGLILIPALILIIASVLNRGVFHNLFTLVPVFLLASHHTPFWNPQRLDLLRKLKAEGKSDTEIAGLMGVLGEDGRPSGDAVKMCRSRHHIPSKYSKSATVSIKDIEEQPPETPIHGDMAQRIEALLGHAPIKEVEATPLPDVLLKEFVNSYEPFVKELIEDDDLSLFPYQWDMLRTIHDNKKSILCCGRRVGKDFVSSLYSLWHVLTHPGSRVICVSDSQRASDHWLEAGVMSHALQHPLTLETIITKSVSQLDFSNGSRILSFPLGSRDSYTLRGFGADILIINEAMVCPESLFASVMPFIATRPEAKLIISSTPGGKNNPFYQYYSSGLFAIYHVSSDKSPLISPEFLEEQRELLGDLIFQCEYGGQFIDIADQYFSSNLITSCLEDLKNYEHPRNSKMKITFGLDWGYTNSETVLFIISSKPNPNDPRKPVLTTEFIKVYPTSKPIHAQLSDIKHYYDIYTPRKVLADASGFSQISELGPMGVPAKDYKFTLESKARLFQNLKLCMEEGRLKLPRGHRALFHQLSSFVYEVSRTGQLKLHHAIGTRDDICDALALAVFAAKTSTERIWLRW